MPFHIRIDGIGCTSSINCIGCLRLWWEHRVTTVNLTLNMCIKFTFSNSLGRITLVKQSSVQQHCKSVQMHCFQWFISALAAAVATAIVGLKREAELCSGGRFCSVLTTSRHPSRAEMLWRVTECGMVEHVRNVSNKESSYVFPAVIKRPNL